MLNRVKVLQRELRTYEIIEAFFLVWKEDAAVTLGGEGHVAENGGWALGPKGSLHSTTREKLGPSATQFQEMSSANLNATNRDFSPATPLMRRSPADTTAAWREPCEP